MSQNWDDYGELCLEHGESGTMEAKQLVARCLNELRKTGEEAEVRKIGRAHV